ncbi:hypothetical protein BHE74_00038279 [Ensete ventricosum]|nr:hypothetical protein BHE74_00038279 [Ensete ventricosum]
MRLLMPSCHQRFINDVTIGSLEHLGMVAGGLSTSDQKNLGGCRPIMNDCMTNKGWAFGTPRISVAKQATKWERGLSSFWLRPRSMAVDNLGRALAKKLSLNYLTS